MKKIKKFFLVICVFLLLFAIVSCKNNEDPPEELIETHPVPEELISLLEIDFKTYSPMAGGYPSPFCERIDSIIEDDAKVIKVTFGENYYYVAAYMDIADDHEKFEVTEGCCTDKYTWIGFNDINEIKKYNGTKRLITSYQINLSSTGEDILGITDENPIIARFLEIDGRYQEYEDGIVHKPEHIEFKETYIHKIYLAGIKDGIYYCDSLGDRLYEKKTHCFDYAEINGEIYFTVEANDEDYLKNWEFWKYYDKLSQIMITGKYSTTDSYGNKRDYILFKLEDFKEFIQTIKEAGE